MSNTGKDKELMPDEELKAIIEPCDKLAELIQKAIDKERLEQQVKLN